MALGLETHLYDEPHQEKPWIKISTWSETTDILYDGKSIDFQVDQLPSKAEHKDEHALTNG